MRGREKQPPVYLYASTYSIQSDPDVLGIRPHQYSYDPKLNSTICLNIAEILDIYLRV